MNFRSALLSAYLENPCQVLPNACWKTTAQLGSLNAHFSQNQGRVDHLEAWDDHKLLVHWNRDRACLPPFIRELQSFRMIILHQDFLGCLTDDQFPRRKPFFRLFFPHSPKPVDVQLPSGFSLAPVVPSRDNQAVSDFISMCYADIHPPAEVVFTWTQHPVFDPNLWVWVVDETRGIPAGLGIAEVDRSLGEGSLEWIQVLPQYRGRGVGKLIVKELLARLNDQVQFSTVSGEATSETYAESLYRRCGFTGGDVWWVCRSMGS